MVERGRRKTEPWGGPFITSFHGTAITCPGDVQPGLPSRSRKQRARFSGQGKMAASHWRATVAVAVTSAQRNIPSGQLNSGQGQVSPPATVVQGGWGSMAHPSSPAWLENSAPLRAPSQPSDPLASSRCWTPSPPHPGARPLWIRDCLREKHPGLLALVPRSMDSQILSFPV